MGAAKRLDQVRPVEGPGEVPGESDEMLELGRVACRRETAVTVNSERPKELRPDPERCRHDDPVSGRIASLAREAGGFLDAGILGEG